ncbi:MAG: purine-binding chemotaxis protein CheW [Spirochaetes bacterium]|nr:purine-binding chemotaxis protein CheW [Spirochaetota bacterium]
MEDIKSTILKQNDDEEREHQHVTFLIGDETYGVGVEKVKEIIGMTDITHVPNAAFFMEGVINLRGSVVPVVDLRKKFKMHKREYDNYTVIIIVEVKDRLIGMIVDSVSDVVNIPVSSIQSTPQFTAKIKTDFIEGIGRIENNLIILLDVDMILTEDEIETIETIENSELSSDSDEKEKKTGDDEDQ